jgi:hypothetical protein
VVAKELLADAKTHGICAIAVMQSRYKASWQISGNRAKWFAGLK